MSLLSRRTLLTTAIGGFAGVGLWHARSRFLPTGGLEPAAQANPSPNGELAAFHRTSRALGTNVSITIAHTDESVANRAAAAAFDELERVEQSLSVYRNDSQLGMLNSAQSLASADERMRAVLAASLEMSRRTAGAFDVTVQPLWEVHSRAARELRSPTEAELAAVRERIGWQHVLVAGTEVRFARPDMSITFNGIAQGYATDRVKLVLQSVGVQHALIDIGELAPLGHKALGTPWQAGIQHPRQADAYVAVAKLDGRSLATSGDYATTFTDTAKAGRGDNHIFDPATGHSPTAFSSVSVVAPTAMEADALSTALFVLGPKRGLKLIESSEGVDALFVTREGRVSQTAGFPTVRDAG
ncbi:FAD:protein FMN transferase [Humisphaera borealis]|uniref:FAD:protein FMN transferase n=1 Tax=Humisphaera borealis TaxID=2807512 RepID=A0A7M2X2R6_9BACT|nr:FAD:protein FMN transferase [Humisphaera borealis]QOV91722.1 FAD:protein FMN transferase [Humisphaera borealis]